MTQSKTRYPSAFYAAAGVGDLVYEQLRKLQLKAIEFGNEQAPQWKRRVADFTVKVDAVKVRETVVTGTQAAAERATKVYDTLVARGEKAFADETEAVAHNADAVALKADTGTFKVEADAIKVEPGATRSDVPIAKKATAAAPRKKAA
jgi:hypothetical protein